MLNLTVQLIFYCRYLFPLYSKYSSKLIFRFSWTYCEVAPFYLNMFETTLCWKLLSRTAISNFIANFQSDYTRFINPISS